VEGVVVPAVLVLLRDPPTEAPGDLRESFETSRPLRRPTIRKESSMKGALSLAALGVLVGACGAAAGEDAEPAARKVFGEAFVKVEGEKAASANLAALCKGWKFHVVTKGHPGGQPLKSGNPPLNVFTEHPLLALSKGEAVAIGSYESAARFLTNLKAPVADEASALARCLAFLELTGGTLRTSVPARESLIGIYVKQDPRNWDLVISGTDAGWKVTATASVNQELDFCIRFELDVGKDGAVRLTGRRDVYAYTLYE
jgi:hypothetical protein